MEFLVEFEINVPDGADESEVKNREAAEAAAAAKLANEGHLVRVWKRPVADGEPEVLGLYRTDSQTQLDGLLSALPLYEWMEISVIPLEPHPNDSAAENGNGVSDGGEAGMSYQLPKPRLTQIYRLDATLEEPLDLGEIAQGHRRIVPLTGGTFTGPELSGRLLPGASADWQIVLPDGTALGDIRYTLQADTGDLLYVQSRGIRHGSAEVLARLGRGEDVKASEYTFRTSTQIETAAHATGRPYAKSRSERRRPSVNCPSAVRPAPTLLTGLEQPSRPRS
jgi:muconolactone delta-isomerase